MEERVQQAVSQHIARPDGSVHTHVTVTVVNGRTYNPVTAMVVFLCLICLPALPILFCVGLVALPYLLPLAFIIWGVRAIYNRLQD